MATIVAYERVLETLLGQGLRSLYYNSGSFGFGPGVKTRSVGWLIGEDPTLRPEALPLTRQLAPRTSATLVERTLQVWDELHARPAWLLPRSHWAYELDFGSRSWMPGLLGAIGIDAKLLEPLTTGDAIQFDAGDRLEFVNFFAGLLDNLSGSSDFQLLWPGTSLICTVHHHRQLWWTAPQDAAAENVTSVFEIA